MGTPDSVTVPPEAKDAGTPQGKVTHLGDAYVHAYMAAFPEGAFLSGIVLHRNDGLSDNSLAGTRDSAIRDVWAGGWPEAEAMDDRVVKWPGQLTAYDTGALEIFALREQAKRELGERFDIREFHDQVLANEAITLPMLRQVIEHWVALKKGH